MVYAARGFVTLQWTNLRRLSGEPRLAQDILLAFTTRIAGEGAVSNKMRHFVAVGTLVVAVVAEVAACQV